jgi:flagellar hook-length control protein FliK
MHAPIANGTQGDAPQGGMSQDSGQSHDHTSKSSSPVTAATATEAATLSPQVDLPNVLTGVAAPTAPQPPASVHPTEVVNQIAQQVDLYRLPGNKGVRIQLHPEDLGGVQVTLKYASGGNLELHISVEHAATGELVQAGINQLRDALATQGFQPDRMVMSVSAPSAASGQMDFSSNGNGSYRSDPGLNAFMQNGQSDQRGGPSQDDLAGLGWTSSDDGSSSPEVTSSSGGVVATSRIDYRV